MKEQGMPVVRAVNSTKNVILAERVVVADSFIGRGWGLLGHSCLRQGEGVLITRTNWIHSFFMRFPFDAVYVDGCGAVWRLLLDFPPFRLGPRVPRARDVLELAAGTIARTDTAVGDVIVFEPVFPRLSQDTSLNKS